MTRRSTSGPIWSDLSTPAPSPQLSPDKRHDRRRGTRAGHRPGEPDRSLDWGSLWARSGVAPPAHPAARAGSTLLRFGAHALGRLVHAVLRNEDSVCAGIQAAHLRRRNLVSDAGPRGGHGEHGRNRVADSARVRPPHPLGGARLLCMTAIIQLTYPDGWANFHLYWAAMALAILTFGPGAISLDRLIGLDGWSARRLPNAIVDQRKSWGGPR